MMNGGRALCPDRARARSEAARALRCVDCLTRAPEELWIVDLEERIDLAGCIAGDAAAWERFVNETAAFVLATVRRASRGSIASIDDDAQEVFVRLVRDQFRLLRAFDPTRARLSTYLGIIARTVVHERTRKRSLPQAPEGAAALVEDRREDETARLRAAREHAAALPLEVLSPAQRAVLTLIHEQGLSVEQTAERLGIAPQTVRSAHHKAISRLRRELGVDPS